jgi:hypothetical protein
VLEAGARKDAPVPEPVAASLVDLVGLDVRGHAAEWNDDEVYVALPGRGAMPGSASIARPAVTSERTDRGWVSYFNDLHKGRNSGAGWFWFIDVFAAACVIFTLTGLLLLQLRAASPVHLAAGRARHGDPARHRSLFHPLKDCSRPCEKPDPRGRCRGHLGQCRHLDGHRPAPFGRRIPQALCRGLDRAGRRRPGARWRCGTT